MWGLFDRVRAMLEGAQVTSDEGVAFIAAEEGFVPRIYLDGNEPGVPIAERKTGKKTIGYGHLLRPGEEERYCAGITREEARDLLIRDLAIYERAVRDAVKVPLEQHQFDALVSLCFNVGVGEFTTSVMVARLNAGDFDGAAERFAVWRLSDGRVDGRLVARRARERAMFER